MRLADIFTTIRLFLAPAFIFLFLHQSRVASIGVLIAAALTDWLDGYFARREKKSWKYGKFYDAIVDKFLVVCVISAFVIEKVISPTEAMMIMSRTIIVITVLVVLSITVKKRKKLVIPASRMGKITTVVQFLTLVAITLGLPYIQPMIFFVFILGVFAGLGYMVEWKKKFVK